jgi:hypothetical protein
VTRTQVTPGDNASSVRRPAQWPGTSSEAAMIRALPTRSLTAPVGTPGTANLIDLYQLWMTPGTWQTVQAWVSAQPPTGSSLASCGRKQLLRGAVLKATAPTSVVFDVGAKGLDRQAEDHSVGDAASTGADPDGNAPREARRDTGSRA